MATEQGKENIADGLIAAPQAKPKHLSPKKPSRKTRSKSIGPGALGALEEPALRESNGNRRKSAFIPAVKSILSSNDEEEKKRKEARRKSLARRRVSFAPEATLHTWDVVEYLRDATTSSSSSEQTRRASNVSQASAAPTPDSDAEEPPSTPPAQVEEPEPEPSSSPGSQRVSHQKKNRRRSSGIPPMNFNNPDDLYSSSPLSAAEKSPAVVNKDASLKTNNDGVSVSADSPELDDPLQSSLRLEAALQHAASQAGDQGQKSEQSDEDVSMELTEEGFTASFQPWVTKPNNMPNVEQGSSNSFTSTGLGQSQDNVGDDDEDDNENDDLSMEMTLAVGRIVPSSKPQSLDDDSGDDDDDGDISMDLTLPLGKIQQMKPNGIDRRKSLKRGLTGADASQGSPAKRQSVRRASLRRQSIADNGGDQDDEAMDFTVAIGAIKNQSLQTRQNIKERRMSTESTIEDQTMDLTVAVGSIKDISTNGMKTDGDLSMDLTKAVGSIQYPELPNVSLDSPTDRQSPTPIRAPAKSPSRRGSARISNATPAPAPQSDSATPLKKQPAQTQVNSSVSTPNASRTHQRIEDFEPSPFVRNASQDPPVSTDAISTPRGIAKDSEPMLIPNDPIAAPILNRRRSSLSSVQFSPLAAAREGPTLKSTMHLANNIKLLSTPRKQTLASSPLKKSMTPKKTPQKDQTPRQDSMAFTRATPRESLSPIKRVAFGPEPPAETQDEQEDNNGDGEEVERISLQDFLSLTKIRFMDLSTTKRRHTAAPTEFHNKEIEEKEETLDQYVVAAACTLPEFELYQHACHEMKKFISDGRHFVRTMEANVMEDNPMLFSEYLTAPPDQRTIMDNQFKNLKTSARLEARGEWYGWRSSLLRDLKVGLIGTMDGFKRDESIIVKKEKLVESMLPALSEKYDHVRAEHQRLQQRQDELDSCDREELDETRNRLVNLDTELVERRQLLAQLEQELADKEMRITAAKERKAECLQEIKAAERVRKDCRGWSTTEVMALKVKINALEKEHGWSVSSASTDAITMTHRNELEVYFQPSAFATGKVTQNAAISLSYIGDVALPRGRPLTTSKRFFLQIIRAHLHGMNQAQSRVSEMLTIVKNSWATACAVAEGTRWLEHSYTTEETILSDERMAISTYMLLPSLQTKVKIVFEIGVGINSQGVDTEVSARAELIYGEKYSEDKMGSFLRDFCGNTIKEKKDMAMWADAVLDLTARLKHVGRKGERA